ncbi:hypothetical protein AJ79_03616 [Helicocarpus griseus UAMH5409]|uniref:Uncharacterized protein n=1 Tax=Helicocarpus griseus UAMH5409 TaxID=1447875 RepID=A0A2B7XWB2_9EURO|nr:hypothetical protein AJ79_03616 [Helicocarpus griseus UAMH5409]
MSQRTRKSKLPAEFKPAGRFQDKKDLSQTALALKEEGNRAGDSRNSKIYRIPHACNTRRSSARLDMESARRNETLRQNVDKWLSATDLSSKHAIAKSKRQGNTALWFVESDSFLEWKSSTTSFCWLHGILGSGKTVMSSVIIEHIRHLCLSNSASALAYFYFDYNDPDRTTPESMIRSLIRQLLNQRPDMPKDLRNLYEMFKEGDVGPEIGKLVEVLQGIIKDMNEVYFVLDALDECSDVSGLLDIASRLLHCTSKKIHSWSRAGKLRALKMALRLFLGMCKRSQWIRFKRFRGYPDIQKSIESHTMDKADGMFQWAVSWLEMLRNCATIQSLQEALTSPPESLHVIYERILYDLDRDWGDYAPKILHWLVFAARPLTITELAETFTINVDSNPQFDDRRRVLLPREMLNMCSSLVVLDVDEDGDEILRLAHLSVKEFILCNYPFQGPLARYHISQPAGNAKLAEICLAYSLHFCKESTLDERTISQFPLSIYASSYWTHHIQLAGNLTDSLRTMTTSILSPGTDTFYNWVRLFDPEPSPSTIKRFGRRKESIHSPLYYMALCGAANVVELLLDDGAEVDYTRDNAKYGTPLQAASTFGYLQVVKQLLSRGADVNLVSGSHGTALNAAMSYGHVDVAQFLLDSGADINLSQERTLQLAAARGSHRIVELLLRKGRNPNSRDYLSNTALSKACVYGHEKVVDLLLKAGADVNAKSGLDDSFPLQDAASKGHMGIFKKVLAKGANPNLKGGTWVSALHVACRIGELSMVEELLANGALIDITGPAGETTLQAALDRGRESVAFLLLDKGANPRWEGGSHGNILQAAAFGGVLSVVKFLIDNGVDVNILGGKYGSALQAASMRGYVEVVKFPIDRGAHVNFQGGYYGTTLLAASSKGHVNVAQVLLSHGAKIDAIVGKYGTAMQEAAAHGYYRVVRLLLENGTDINCTIGHRGLVLVIAARRGNTEVIQVMLKWASDTNAQLDGVSDALGAAEKFGRKFRRDEIVKLLKQ